MANYFTNIRDHFSVLQSKVFLKQLQAAKDRFLGRAQIKRAMNAEFQYHYIKPPGSATNKYLCISFSQQTFIQHETSIMQSATFILKYTVSAA